MTNEHDTSAVLDRLLDDEPPFTLAGTEVRRQARGTRLRRRLAAGAACAVVAGIAVGGAVLADRVRNTDRTPSPASSDEAFSPDVLANSIATALRSEAPQARGTGAAVVEVAALDAQSNEITGADRDKASLWTGSVDLSASDRLELSLVNQPTTLEQATTACAGELAEGMSLSCDAATTGDHVVLSQVRAVRRQDGAWPVVLVNKLDTAKPGSLWFQRRVTATTADGSTVMVNEFVQAPTLEAAEAEWSITTDGLVSIATNSTLAFPNTNGVDECGWVVPEHAADLTCGS